MQSRHGYHIVQVLDYKTVPIVTEQAFASRAKKIRYLAEYKLGDYIAANVIDSMMQNVDIKVYPKTMQQVGTRLGEHFTRQPSKYDAMYERQLSEAEYHQISNSLWDNRNKPLAMINGEELTIGEFVAALEYVPYDLLFKGFKQALDVVCRDVLLTREAEQLELYNKDDVKTQTTLYREYLLQLKLKRQLVSQVNVTESEIRKEFNAVKAQHPNVTFESTADVLHEKILRRKKQNAVPVFLDSLQKDITIETFPDRIHHYYESVYRPQESEANYELKN
ncbi:MAG: hypothetical protein U5R06_03280 [candidate division KSB1 bacterium]|nr:hypothetical protein [candidate division KSB1 bacterium]